MRSKKRSRDSLNTEGADVSTNLSLCCSILGIKSDECIVAKNGLLIPGTFNLECNNLDVIKDRLDGAFKADFGVRMMQCDTNWKPSFDGQCILDLVFGHSKFGYGHKFNNDFASKLMYDHVALVEYLNQFIFVVNNPYQYWFRCYDQETYQEQSLTTLKEKFSEAAVKIWLRSDRKKEFVKSDFIIDEQKVDTDIFNMYVRPPMLELEYQRSLDKMCPKILDFLKRIISNDDNERFEYIMKWLATMLRYGKTGICLVLLGKKGTGKSTFIQLASALIGKEYYSSLENIHDLNSQFNSQLYKSIIIGIEEVGEKAFKNRTTQNKLKAYITEPSVRVEKKGMDSFTARNNCNFIICSNFSNPVDITEDNRRFTVFEVNDCEMQNHKYFNSLMEELKDQTVIQHLRYYLYYCVSATSDFLEVLHTPEEKELLKGDELPSDAFVQQFITNGVTYKSAWLNYEIWTEKNGNLRCKESDFRKSLKRYGYITERTGKDNLTCIFAVPVKAKSESCNPSNKS